MERHAAISRFTNKRDRNGKKDGSGKHLTRVIVTTKSKPAYEKASLWAKARYAQSSSKE